MNAAKPQPATSPHTPPPPPPPHSVEAERGVLGSIIVGMGGLPYELAIRAGLTEDTFYVPANKTVFSGIKQLAAKGYPIDPIALADLMRTDGTLKAIGGTRFLQDIIDETPTTAHIEYYLAIIAEKHLFRQAIAAADHIKAQAVKQQQSGEMIRSAAELAFATMVTANAKPRRSVADIARASVQAWEDNATGNAHLGIQTGIKWLDDATAGIMKGSYWVISGRPGSCKSTLCRMIAESVAARGIPATVKTTEQTEEQYVGAMVAAHAKISVHQLNLPGFPPARLHFLRKAEADVATWPLCIDGDMCTTSQLASWYGSSAAKGSKVQILDYLQDIIPETKEERANPEQKVSRATQEIRRCSKTTGIPAVIVSTESNSGDLRYSGQIEYDASCWLRMKKSDDFDPHANPKYEVEIKKSRFAPAGTVIELYHLYGKLLEEQDYHAQLAIMSMAALAAPSPPAIP